MANDQASNQMHQQAGQASEGMTAAQLQYVQKRVAEITGTFMRDIELRKVAMEMALRQNGDALEKAERIHAFFTAGIREGY